jgi:hypothetical protein
VTLEPPLIPGTLLVIDADLNPRIAHDLRERGRHAYSLAQLKLKDAKDPVMLPTLYARYPACVLVTGDDNMPREHPEAIALAGATIATITGLRPGPYTAHEEPWQREVIHRWAHKMQAQDPKTIVRYGAAGGRVWTPQRRRG